MPESDWRLHLGKVTYYHYTNPAKQANAGGGRTPGVFTPPSKNPFRLKISHCDVFLTPQPIEPHPLAVKNKLFKTTTVALYRFL